MIVVDTSAIIAIFLREPERDHFISTIMRSEHSRISALNVHEATIVLRRRNGQSAIGLVWAQLSRLRIDIVPFGEDQAKAAAAAYDRYGKGIDPKALLNLADCAAYALAKTLNMPLLFKGQDFAATDVRSAG